MVSVKAIWDGEKIVLPPHVQRSRDVAVPVSVTIEFPEGVLASATGPIPSASSAAWHPRSVWDIIEDDYTPKRTFAEAIEELEEGRGPRDGTAGADS